MGYVSDEDETKITYKRAKWCGIALGCLIILGQLCILTNMIFMGICCVILTIIDAVILVCLLCKVWFDW